MFGRKKKLLEAARNNDAAGVDTYFRRGSSCYEACLEAVAHNAPDALEKLLTKNNGYYFFDSWSQNQELGKALWKAMEDAGSPDSLFLAAYASNGDNMWSCLEEKNFMTKGAPLDVIRAVLEKDPSLFETGVNNIGLLDTAKLKFVLTFTPKDGSAQQVLNAALISAAEKGDAGKVAVLLQYNADPDYAGGRALARAAEKGYDRTVGLLLPLVNLADHGKDIITQLELKGANPRIIATLDSATRDALKKNPCRTAAAETPAGTDSAENYARLDGHTLAEIQILPNNATLTTLFNFATGQQQIILTDAQNNASAPVVVPFRDIDEKLLAALREKFDALAVSAAAAPQQEAAANESPNGKNKLASSGVAARLKKAGL